MEIQLDPLLTVLYVHQIRDLLMVIQFIINHPLVNFHPSILPYLEESRYLCLVGQLEARICHTIIDLEQMLQVASLETFLKLLMVITLLVLAFSKHQFRTDFLLML